MDGNTLIDILVAFALVVVGLMIAVPDIIKIFRNRDWSSVVFAAIGISMVIIGLVLIPIQILIMSRH